MSRRCLAATPANARRAGGLELDFLFRAAGADPELVRVCADLSDPATLGQELRAMEAASAEHPRASRRLLVLDHDQVPPRGVAGAHVQTAYEWLLDGPREA